MNLYETFIKFTMLAILIIAIILLRDINGYSFPKTYYGITTNYAKNQPHSLNQSLAAVSDKDCEPHQRPT